MIGRLSPPWDGKLRWKCKDVSLRAERLVTIGGNWCSNGKILDRTRPVNNHVTFSWWDGQHLHWSKGVSFILHLYLQCALQYEIVLLYWVSMHVLVSSFLVKYMLFVFGISCIVDLESFRIAVVGLRYGLLSTNDPVVSMVRTYSASNG